jgi:hypothetical protein
VNSRIKSGRQNPADDYFYGIERNEPVSSLLFCGDSKSIKRAVFPFGRPWAEVQQVCRNPSRGLSSLSETISAESIHALVTIVHEQTPFPAKTDPHMTNAILTSPVDQACEIPLEDYTACPRQYAYSRGLDCGTDERITVRQSVQF